MKSPSSLIVPFCKNALRMKKKFSKVDYTSFISEELSASYSAQITSGIYGHQGITYPPDHVC